MPRGDWPSTNSTAPLGYAVAYLMFSNDCRAAAGRSQKMWSTRILQVRQFSMMSSPYGESTTSPLSRTAYLPIMAGTPVAHPESTASFDMSFAVPHSVPCVRSHHYVIDEKPLTQPNSAATAMF